MQLLHCERLTLSSSRGSWCRTNIAVCSSAASWQADQDVHRGQQRALRLRKRRGGPCARRRVRNGRQLRRRRASPGSSLCTALRGSQLPAQCMADFFEEEPEDWADEVRLAEEHDAQPQPPEEYQPDAWELDEAAAAMAAQRERHTPEYDPSAPSMRGGCRGCESFTFDQRWREAFGVYLCAALHLASLKLHGQQPHDGVLRDARHSDRMCRSTGATPARRSRSSSPRQAPSM